MHLDCSTVLVEQLVSGAFVLCLLLMMDWIAFLEKYMYL